MISQVIHTSGHSLPQNLLTLFTAIFFDVLICELLPPKLSSVLTEELFCTLFDPVWASFPLLHGFRDAEQWLLRVLEHGRGWGVWVIVRFVKWRWWRWVISPYNSVVIRLESRLHNSWCSCIVSFLVPFLSPSPPSHYFLSSFLSYFPFLPSFLP